MKDIQVDSPTSGHANTSSLQSNTATLESPQDSKTLREKINFGILILGIALSMFMMSLNTTIIAPALSIIATDLHGISSQTWIATAYLVALNAFQPLSGKVKYLITI
jgi:hypothetical protein